jgi:ABC-2 type transport system ATP-binding protein
MDEAERCDRVAIIQAGRMAALGTISELKAVFADRPIFEVRAGDPVKTMAIADTLPIVEKTSLFGTAVHAVMRRGTASPETALRQALEGHGVTIETMERVVPSLDDVFLDVVDRA